MNRLRIKTANARRGFRSMVTPSAPVLTANSSAMSLDWIYSGPACDGFHIFVHQPNEAPGTFNDRVQVAGNLRTWATGFDSPADALGYAYYIVPMDGDGNPLTAQSGTVSFAITPPTPEDLQAQLNALSARVDALQTQNSAQQATIDNQQSQMTQMQGNIVDLEDAVAALQGH